jgi:hypothetical protein
VLFEHDVRRPNGHACEVEAIKAKAAIAIAKRFIVKLQSKVKKQQKAASISAVKLARLSGLSIHHLRHVSRRLNRYG